MSSIVLQIMDYQKGHEQKDFDSTKQDSLRKMVAYIKDKILNENFVLYGASKGEELTKLLDGKSKETKSEYDIEKKLLDNDSFIMNKDTKLLLAPKPTGG
jgi:hypothetical protein